MGLFGGGANLPDLPNIDAQLNLMTRLMEEFGREAERRRAIIEPLETKFLESIEELVNTYAPEAARQFQFGNELRELYRTKALPAEQRLFDQLQNYDTPERRAMASSRAMAGVVGAVQGRQQAQRMELRRAGVNPNDPRYAETFAAQIPEVAALAAAEGRRAREGVEETGVMRRIAATELGRGWQTMGDAAARQGLALSSGVASARQGAFNTVAALGGRPIDWQSAQLQVADNYINTLMDRYRAKMDRAAARRSAASGFGRALGTLAGAGLGFAMGGGFGGGLAALQGASMGAGLGGSLFGAGQDL